MCGYRSYRRERYLDSSWGDRYREGLTSAASDERPASEAEREAVLASLRRHAAADGLSVKEFGRRSDEALAATSRAELYAALSGLADPVVPGAPGRRRAGPFGGFPLLPIIALALVIVIASHGWFIFPLAFLVFGVLRPWGRRRRRAHQPPITRF